MNKSQWLITILLIVIIWASYLEYTDVLNYNFNRHDWGGDHDNVDDCSNTMFGVILNDTSTNTLYISWYGGCKA